jgi:Phosphotransferase enzyme family
MGGITLTQGGSGASVILRNRVVVKRSLEDGAEKLIAEANWLQWIHDLDPDGIGRRFPAVRAMPTMDRPELVLEALPGLSARDAVLAGDRGDLRRILGDAIVFAFRRLPQVTASPHRWAIGAWCARHMERGLRRAASTHPEVADLMGKEHLYLGGKTVSNPLSHNAQEVVAALLALRPARTLVIHGDLHLGNILVSPEDGRFFLVDPRGGWDGKLTFDPAYDVAKLLHEPAYLRARTPSWSADCDERLNAISEANQALARFACGILESTDPTVAARATLMTGMHLSCLLRLRHTSDYDVRSLLESSIRWLRAGLAALDGQLSPAQCHRVWMSIYAEPHAPVGRLG